MIEPYPLHWPSDYPKTPPRQRRSCDEPIRATGTDLYNHTMGEMMRVNAHSLTLSTNLPLGEGVPRWYASPLDDDPGVALWFVWHGRPMVLANDTFVSVRENLYAIGRLVTNFRVAYGLGMGQSMERMLLGLEHDHNRFFRTEKAGSYSPPPPDPTVEGPTAGWWHVFGFSSIHEASLKEAESRYRQRVQQAHPDRGGSTEAMQVFNEAIEQARNYFGKGKNQ